MLNGLGVMQERHLGGGAEGVYGPQGFTILVFSL